MLCAVEVENVNVKREKERSNERQRDRKLVSRYFFVFKKWYKIIIGNEYHTIIIINLSRFHVHTTYI